MTQMAAFVFEVRFFSFFTSEKRVCCMRVYIVSRTSYISIQVTHPHCTYDVLRTYNMRSIKIGTKSQVAIHREEFVFILL